MTRPEEPEEIAAALELATRFHEAYERLAPSFGYETREETRQFDAESKNGRLMVAVCGEILRAANPPGNSESSTEHVNPSDWWCPSCQRHVSGYDVTHHERHDTRSGGCGNFVMQERPHPAPEVPECHGCKHWTVDPQAKEFDKPYQYGRCRGIRGDGVEIETSGDCCIDAINTDATFGCNKWGAR